jgi:integrase
MKKNSFLYLLQDITQQLKDGDILNYGKRFSKKTINSYEQVYNTMSSFKYNFNLDSVDLNNVSSRRERLKVSRQMQRYVNDYLNILQEKRYHPNTRKSHLKTIRTTLKKGEKYYGYMFPKIESMRELKTEVVTLNPYQVNLIHTTPPKKSLKDMWYYTRIALYSCMRISDLINFECTMDGNVVTILTKKGMGALSTFYLPDDVCEFIKEKGSPKFSKNHFRSLLKELLQEYSEFWKKKTVYKYDHEGNPTQETSYLWELITPHKLRSSGITFHLTNGLTELDVRRISGHANNSSAFYRYVNASDTKSLKQQKENSVVKIS